MGDSISSRCAVLFADLAGFTALNVAHGDLDAADVASRFCAMSEWSLRGGARVVKTIGDAVMVVAAEPHDALESALGLMRAVAAEPDFPGVRMGLHLGPVLERDDDYFGLTVNVAARLAEHAHVGQMLSTRDVVATVTPADRVKIRSLGETLLKHVPDPLELFSIEDASRQSDAQILDPVCKMFVDADLAPASLPWRNQTWHFCSFDCAKKFTANPERYCAKARSGSL